MLFYLLLLCGWKGVAVTPAWRYINDLLIARETKKEISIQGSRVEETADGVIILDRILHINK